MSRRGFPAASAARRALALLLALAAIVPAQAYAQSAEPRATLPDIEDEVMCPICGTLLQMSQSPQAERQRAFIDRLITQGLDKEQIKDALVAEYGPVVLAVPGKSGFELTAWLLPIVAFLLGLTGIGLAARRWRRDRADSEAPGGAGGGLDPSDDARLRADLRHYEL